ncbi:MAG: hypothetical protein M9894_24905 [Planctomycetes bacterium]|nr:hypothetical protein [Planctomycetota bacterium]
MPVCEECSATFPNRVVIRGKVRVLSSRRFCLACSPFGARNTRASLRPAPPHESKTCARCKWERPLDAFYPRRDRNGHTPYCKACYRAIDYDRQRRIKAALVASAGGKCTRCGYSRCLAALEFHHRDPREKDPQLFRNKHRRAQIDEAIRLELSKCDLVCSNCHRELHDEMHLAAPDAPA